MRINKSVLLKKGTFLICGTKDDDGNSPYSVVLLKSNGETLLSRSVGRAFHSCVEVLQKRKVVRDRGVTFCVTKDNDGLNPY